MNMLNSLKHTGQTLGREAARAWETLSQGWHELLSRSNNALTHFKRPEPAEATSAGAALATFPSWSLLAGELEETARDVLVRVELPGLDKDDCQICIEGNVLYLSGEKRFERDTSDSTYHVMERAYGSFQRSIALPSDVDVDRAEATFKNGVLTVRLPKVGSGRTRAIEVT